MSDPTDPTDPALGMSIHLWVSSLWELKYDLRICLAARILRCVSPLRDDMCNDPATTIYWQDAAEWYPCCDRHRVKGAQWTGSTSFAPHELELLVIPGVTQEWLETQAAESRCKIRVQTYERETS